MGTKRFKVQKTVSVQTTKGFKLFQMMNKGLSFISSNGQTRILFRVLFRPIHRLVSFKAL